MDKRDNIKGPARVGAELPGQTSGWSVRSHAFRVHSYLKQNLSVDSLKGKTAFTLIEVLVVIAIIGALAALILPSLSSARNTARSVKCLSNLRQIGLAVNTYASDNDRRLPAMLGGTMVTNGSGNGIHIKVHTHGKWAVDQDFGPLGTTEILVCPGDKQPAVINTTDLNNNPLTIKTSYAFNYALWIANVRMATINPSSVMLAIDSSTGFDPQQGVWYVGINPAKAGKDVDNFNTNVADRRHLKRFNALFLDGHAERLTNLVYNSILPGVQ